MCLGNGRVLLLVIGRACALTGHWSGVCLVGRVLGRDLNNKNVGTGSEIEVAM